jgi:hypothetical protein
MAQATLVHDEQPRRPERAVVYVFVIGIVAQVIGADFERPPGVNLVEVVRAVNRKTLAVAVLAQFVLNRYENGYFGALRQIRQKFGVVIGDP